MDEPFDDSTLKNCNESSAPTGEGIVIDIGTGDGHFVYRLANRNPKKFYIGIDPNTRPLEKLSERIHRRQAKGGLANAMFVQAAVEDLPLELNGIADEVHIHFPWGSLLRAVAIGDDAVLRGLRRICAGDAVMEIIIGFDPSRDQAEMSRLGLPGLSEEYLSSELVPKYRSAGFDVFERGFFLAANWPDIDSTWAKRLRGGSGRRMLYLLARATPMES